MGEPALNEHERYLFDLQGFLAVPDVLDRTALDELNGLFDAQVAEHVPADASTFRFQSLLDWGTPLLALIDHARIVPYLDAILGEWFRLDHEYGDLIRRGKGPIGTRLHGGSTPFDPSQYYLVREGRIHSGLLVVAYNLCDVNPGDGGFAAVPGSHKANYEFPPEWIDLDVPQLPPYVRPVTGPAGTAIIFTEALTHGTLPWRGAGERRTLFYKYSPHAVSWSARYYDADADAFDGLTERQRAILEPPNSRYRQRYGGR